MLCEEISVVGRLHTRVYRKGRICYTPFVGNDKGGSNVYLVWGEHRAGVEMLDTGRAEPSYDKENLEHVGLAS